MRRAVGFITLAAILAAWLVSCNKNNDPYNIPNPDVGQWADFGTGTGTGFVGLLANPFQLPAQSSGKSVNYVYTKPAGKLAVGHVVTLNFTIDGDATYGAADPGEACPCHVGLLIWRAGDELSGQGKFASYRFFSRQTAPLEPGTQLLSVSLDPSAWINVWGQSDPSGFAAALANAQYIGFTFGGVYFAGHGAWTTSGNATFNILSFTVQ